MARVDCAYFTKYDGIAQDLYKLRTADADLQAARQQLSQATMAEQKAEKQRVENAHELESHQKKVDKFSSSGLRNKTIFRPGTWMGGGVKAKLERNEAKVAEEKEAAKNLEAAEQKLEQDVAALQQKVAQTQQLSGQKASLEREASSMFEAAVATAPTSTLQSLETAAANHRTQVQFEQTNTAIVQQVATLCGQAREHYYRSMRALQGAQATNRGAQVNNLIGGRNGGMEMVEQMQDMRRNNLMREAQAEAQAGGDAMGQAFSMVPPAARQRYPELCQGLGEVHIPDVGQMGFGSLMVQAIGGDFVDAMVDMRAGQKIRQALNALGECERIVAQQEGLVTALLATMQRDGANAASALQQTNGQIGREKRSIFDNLRSGCGAAASSVPAATGGTPVAFVSPEEVSSKEVQAAVKMQSATRARYEMPEYAGPPVQMASYVMAPPGQQASYMMPPQAQYAGMPPPGGGYGGGADPYGRGGPVVYPTAGMGGMNMGGPSVVHHRR